MAFRLSTRLIRIRIQKIRTKHQDTKKDFDRFHLIIALRWREAPAGSFSPLETKAGRASALGAASAPCLGFVPQSACGSAPLGVLGVLVVNFIFS